MKKIFLLLFAAAAGYCLLLAKPDLYYGKSLEYKNFTLRSHEALPENVEGVLDKVIEKISTAELYKPEQKFTIYLTGSRGEFRFFTPFQDGDYYRVNPLNGAIYLAAAEFAADRVRITPGDTEYRTLSVEIIKAAATEMVRSSVEQLSYLFMRDWKIRGYAERVSGGTGAFTPADICTGKNSDPAFQDFAYGQAVDFVMKEEGISFRDLLDKDYSYESVMLRLKKMVNC